MVSEWKNLVGISDSKPSGEDLNLGVRAQIQGLGENSLEGSIVRNRNSLSGPFMVNFNYNGANLSLTSPQLSFDGGVFNYNNSTVTVSRLSWLTPTVIKSILRYIPDAVSCLAGGVTITTNEDLYTQNINNLRLTPPSFQIGGDDYRKNIPGTGAKVRVMAVSELAKALPDLLIYTDATFSNREQAHSGMPYQSIVYERELRKRGVENKVIRLDDDSVVNTFGEMVALVKAVASNPRLSKVAIITNRYHVRRVEAFMDVVLRNNVSLNANKIFENMRRKLGIALLTPELVEATEEIKKRRVYFHPLSAEKLLLAIDNERERFGWKGMPFTVLYSMVYPPYVPRYRLEESTKEINRLYDLRRKLLNTRLALESQGVDSIFDGSYYAS